MILIRAPSLQKFCQAKTLKDRLCLIWYSTVIVFSSRESKVLEVRGLSAWLKMPRLTTPERHFQPIPGRVSPKRSSLAKLTNLINFWREISWSTNSTMSQTPMKSSILKTCLSVVLTRNLQGRATASLLLKDHPVVTHTLTDSRRINQESFEMWFAKLDLTS